LSPSSTCVLTEVFWRRLALSPRARNRHQSSAVGHGRQCERWFCCQHGSSGSELGGSGATIAWGTGGIGNGTGSLILSSTTAWADVDFQNPINLNVTTGTVNRTITVNDNTNTGLDYATISGVISNAGAGTGGLIKNGAGTLILGNANTYNGNTSLQDGTLIISSIGNATGTTASSVGASGGTLEFNGNTTLNLLYAGAGETTTRPIRFNTALTAARTHRLDSSGAGALVLEDLDNNTTGNFALLLELRGRNTDGNRINSVLDNGAASGGLGVIKADGGVWILGNTANTFTGGVRAEGGLLGLVSNGSLGAAGIVAPTSAASANSTTVTVGTTTAANLRPACG